MPCTLEDEGSISRHYDLDLWFAEKIKQLPERIQKTFPYLLVSKPSSREKDIGLEMFETKNTHVTVKPIELVSYLCILGSEKQDLIVDPFVGSGTTAIAAKLFDRRFIGIEINPDYCAIARKRLSAFTQDSQEQPDDQLLEQVQIISDDPKDIIQSRLQILKKK